MKMAVGWLVGIMVAMTVKGWSENSAFVLGYLEPLLHRIVG